MDPNPALASILSDLRDCNRSFVTTLNRIAEAAETTASWAADSPYVNDLSAQLLADVTSLAGRRSGLMSAVLNAGGTMQQIASALGGRQDFYEMYDALSGAPTD